MGRNSFYLGKQLSHAREFLILNFSLFAGDVGNASKMNLVLQMFSGVALAGLAESMALGKSLALVFSNRFMN